jgi:hypothetical protein
VSRLLAPHPCVPVDAGWERGLSQQERPGRWWERGRRPEGDPRRVHFAPWACSPPLPSRRKRSRIRGLGQTTTMSRVFALNWQARARETSGAPGGREPGKTHLEGRDGHMACPPHGVLRPGSVLPVPVAASGPRHETIGKRAPPASFPVATGAPTNPASRAMRVRSVSDGTISTALRHRSHTFGCVRRSARLFPLLRSTEVVS